MLRDLVELRCHVIVCDAEPKARRDALALGAAEAVGRVEDAPEVSGAIVATPTLDHEASVRALLPRGVPVFCEKPLTASSASAAKLARLGGGRLFVMDKWRYHPAVEYLGVLVRGGTAGAIRRLSTGRLQPGMEGYDVDAIWVLAPHEISIGREILGRLPRPTSASGSVRSGGQGWLEARFRDEVDWTFRVSSEAPGRVRVIEAAFDEAACAWSLDDEFTVRIRRGRVEESVRLEPAAPLRLELEAFLSYLDGGSPPKSSVLEGAEAVLLVERLRKMAAI